MLIHKFLPKLHEKIQNKFPTDTNQQLRCDLYQQKLILGKKLKQNWHLTNLLLEKGKLNSSLILDSYSIKQQIVPINIYFTGSTDLISFLEEKDDIIDLCNDKTKWILQ